MLLTHFFETPDAMNRARYWLSHHGFYDKVNDLSQDDSQWLALSLPMTQVPAVQALLASIERADEEGHPSCPEILTRADGASPEKSEKEGLHWVPRELDDEGNPRVERIREFMAGYHE